MTSLDGGFWAPYFRRVFARQIVAFHQAVEERLLPTFDGLDEEAERIAEEEYNRLGNMPGDANVDMADLAEAAHEAGLAHYEDLVGVRQAILNLSAAALYHMIEQQMLLFHRREVLHPSEEDIRNLFATKVVRQKLGEAGVDLSSLPSWRVVEQLELVANTVKHGDGRSADRLREIRPELLVPPIFRGNAGLMGKPTPFVQVPLAGESVYVTPEDFRVFAKSANSFWLEFADAIDPFTR